MGACLTARQIEALASGSISEQESGPLTEHLEECPSCQEQVNECAENLAYLVRAKAGLIKESDTAGATTNVRRDRPVKISPRAPGRILSIEIPGYVIVRELHFGGQGVVFEAIQQSTKRKVAVKVLLEGLDASDGARKRFEREIELVASLKHPNIVAVFDSGTAADGRQYYVMDFVRGLPLHRHVREKKLPLRRTLELFREICDAVNHAHQRGVIHRDLKPSNIVVTDEGSPKVLDFGLAKWISAPVETLISQAGQVLGTIPYMSPEQIKGDPDDVDVRSDVYSLGILLYEMLTGTHPYPTTGEFSQVFHHITGTAPASPRETWDAETGVSRTEESGPRTRRRCPIDEELETIVLTSLKKEREPRYQSAGELSRDITRYLNGEPIEAKRDSMAYVLRKAMWRYRYPVGVLSLFAVMLMIGLFALSIQRANLARQRGALDRSEAGQMIAALVDEPVEAMKRIDGASAPVQAGLLDICGLYLASSSYADRIMGARAGLLVDPNRFWASVDGGPLWDNGEWLELCDLGDVAPKRLVEPLREKAQAGTDRQKYVAFCVLGQLGIKTDALADLCAKAVETEQHPGVVSAARWAAGRLGRDVPYRPSSSIVADPLTGLTFVRVPSTDSFRRGADPEDPHRLPDEVKPDKSAAIAPFYLSTTEVTLAALKPFFDEMADQGALGDAVDYLKMEYETHSEPEWSGRAAGYLSLDVSHRFCAWLNQRAEKANSGHRYRVPTEDQWEYACRGGGDKRFCYGDDAKYAEYFAACNGQADAPYVVGQHMPNGYGLFDMHGGLWEWCDSPYPHEWLPEKYRKLPDLDKQKIFVRRGGAYYSPAVRCRSPQRNYAAAAAFDQYLGLRLVLEGVKP